MSDILDAALEDPANYRFEEEPNPEHEQAIIEHFAADCFDEAQDAEVLIVYAPTELSLETDDWNDMIRFDVLYCTNGRAAIHTGGYDEWTDATSPVDAVMRLMTDTLAN